MSKTKQRSGYGCTFIFAKEREIMLVNTIVFRNGKSSKAKKRHSQIAKPFRSFC
jgi:hypothetical protein